MSLLLLIRSADDLRSAVEAASEFLVYRRQRFAKAREADEVLGIWLRRELDADLPAWLDRDRGAGLSIDVPRDTSKVSVEESGVGIRESFSLSGLWTLCWVDGTFLSTAHSAAERRRIILDSLLGTASASRSSSATEKFFPVFAAGDSVESIKATMSELAERYPQISGTWFLDDRERGIVPARE